MRIVSFLIGSWIIGAIAGCSNQETKTLPILGSREPITKAVDGKTLTDTLYHSIPEFKLLNQDSTFITNHTFDNGVYIANFFFTHCPSICPTMQRNLLKVYERYKGDERVRFLSHSIDFRHDSPSVLKRYADKLGVTNDQWQFVTGSKAEIYSLADAYMVYTKEDGDAPGGYDHSGYFLLVDKDKHIRGAYDGTNDAQVQLLLDELALLLKEYE
ncbi:SCO family protein [Parapedobacter sp. ISTM3]|uniref:Protein SCO1/2 n=1 Tax=Parapedobacter luteus TaxID=623280 RepID=A0A1T5AQH2_9SPHI|nr:MULTISPECIES: SCO family protein [Parapedobacter]MBK1441961.1 SCO family protein [Parapedobacter sp. ISTM3]SKB37125.1 protein SCO1/2 [Parapedobacter luteus]